jgi:hypothetical protein
MSSPTIRMMFGFSAAAAIGDCAMLATPTMMAAQIKATRLTVIVLQQHLQKLLMQMLG